MSRMGCKKADAFSTYRDFGEAAVRDIVYAACDGAYDGVEVVVGEYTVMHTWGVLDGIRNALEGTRLFLLEDV